MNKSLRMYIKPAHITMKRVIETSPEINSETGTNTVIETVPETRVKQAPIQLLKQSLRQE